MKLVKILMTDAELFIEVEKIFKSTIKRMVEADGGRISLLRVENSIVYVKMFGACTYCPALPLTLKNGVQRILKSKLSDVKSVELG